MTPMLAVYATATVVVTVGGTRCAWNELLGPLDAEQWRLGPEI